MQAELDAGRAEAARCAQGLADAQAGATRCAERGAELDREAFWKVFHHCTSRLPDKIAKVFLLRELDDLSTEEICSTLAITPGNLWVMLHRARSALRRCLENHWFADVRANGEAAP